MKVLVTGGAGFIGSHLVDSLLRRRENSVAILDDFSQGTMENFEGLAGEEKTRLSIINANLAKEGLETLEKVIPTDCGVVYHLAANPDVRGGLTNPSVHFEQNIVATFNLLEALRKRCPATEYFVFASTSTVYGDASQIPTREDYGPTTPISLYGASKLACEGLISSYARLYGFRALILRLANVVGSRSKHGVIHDFIKKLSENSTTLEILGDGTQSKSYLHVSDCVSAINAALNSVKLNGVGVSVLNIGSSDQISVQGIAELICKEMELKEVEFQFRPATFDGRGWPGDVKNMQLDVSKLKSLGWSSMMNSEQAVARTVKELLRSDEIPVSMSG